MKKTGPFQEKLTGRGEGKEVNALRGGGLGLAQERERERVLDGKLV